MHKNTHRTCTTTHPNRAQCTLHNSARSPAILLMDRTTKRSCTNTTERSISRRRTCMRAVYHAKYTPPTVQMAPTAPVHRTHSCSPCFLSLRRFASVCVKRQLVQKNTKIKKMVQNRTNKSEWYQKSEKHEQNIFRYSGFFDFFGTNKYM